MKFLITSFSCLCFMLGVFTSCTHQQRKEEFAKRNAVGAMNSLFQEYILGRVSAWNNFSFEAGCHLHSPVTYLNYEKLMKSFSFDYYESFEIQKQFNNMLEEKSGNTLLGSILLRDQSSLLATVIERVRAQRFSFDLQSYNRVNLIWIDAVLTQDKAQQAMGKLLQGEFALNGFPVLISFCYSSTQIINMLNNKWHFEFVGDVLGAEAFSRYDSEGSLRSFFAIDMSHIFTPQQKVYIYLPQDRSLPKGIQGNFVNIKFY